ncbi:MAG: hypothetical protein AAB686_00785 [Patescibacteria group bacterium]
MRSHFIRIAGLMAATTIGAGLFSLPYVLYKSGWVVSLLYLVLAVGAIVFAHSLYLRTLEGNGGGKHLLGLATEYFGGFGRGFGLLVIVGGLTLALVIYLVLVGEFSEMLFVGSRNLGLVLFWLAGSLPIIFSRRTISSELVGAVLMTAIILLVFAGFFGSSALNLPVADFKNIFLPFGPLLFALAGWTAIEPIFDYKKQAGYNRASVAMGVGTIFAAVLYTLFVLGILGSAGSITPDTVGGLSNWAGWKFVLLIILGLFAVWTSYVPIGLEIKNALEKDLSWAKTWSGALVLFLPLALVFLGLRDFIKIVGLAGGVFLGLEYLLILMVSQKALNLRGAKMFLVWLLGIIFLLGAVYEVYYFLSIEAD